MRKTWTYCVAVPIYATIYISIEENTKSKAIKKAREIAEQQLQKNINEIDISLDCIDSEPCKILSQI